ncbi:MAG: rod-binding protein [Alphaproteobacteria bacterium]
MSDLSGLAALTQTPDLAPAPDAAARRLSHLVRDGSATPDTLQNAAEEFEAFFLSHVMESMFAGIKTDGAFGGGFGEGIYRSLLLQRYGETIAQQGGVGIADSIVRMFLDQQEVT